MSLQEAAPSGTDKQSRNPLGESNHSNEGYSSDGDDDDNNGYQSSSYGSTFNDDDDDDDQDGTSYNNGSDKNSMDQTTKDFARNETRWVQYIRLLIVVMLIGATAIASFLTYRILSENEQEMFRSQFDEDANHIAEQSQENLNGAFEVFQFFSSMLSTTSYESENPDNKLPFLTLNNFQVLGMHSTSATSARSVSYSPLISNSEITEWETYSVNNQQWIQKSLNIDAAATGATPSQAANITPFIFQISSSSNTVAMEPVADDLAIYSPLWQMTPPPRTSPNLVNYNMLSRTSIQLMLDLVDVARVAMFSQVDVESETMFVNKTELTANGPNTIMVTPVFENILIYNSSIAGHMFSLIPWYVLFQGILKNGQNGIVLVLDQSCGSNPFTYQVNGADVVFLGMGDLHDTKYSNLVVNYTFSRFADDKLSQEIRLMKSNDTGFCTYTVSIYPSPEVESQFTTSQPLYVTLGVLIVFCFTSLMFLLYDAIVQYRQSKLLALATKTSSIVASLFPAQVRDQLFGRMSSVERRSTIIDEESAHSASMASGSSSTKMTKKAAAKKKKPKKYGKSYFSDNNDDDIQLDSRPIADLFPHATVLFGDIAGFTAWSSAREPSQVFTLLETIYRAFDKIAKQRRVFKVETIGDCYLAVVGLPDPCKDHAIVMARFARDILEKLNQLTHRLESTLGPDTGDLNMRIGCHSGPVTAGVLRGERARFQLFGDTVNTAARMESTGMKSRIQVSQETADLIISGGKANWVELREDMVHAKGKGDLQTYWLKHKGERAELQSQMSETSTVSDGAEIIDVAHFAPDAGENDPAKQERSKRMIDWNADILAKLLQRVLATRVAVGTHKSPDFKLKAIESETAKIGNCMQDVVEVIELPKFDENVYDFDPESICVSDKVAKQLRNYVSLIASMYKNNPFHNFEHASHVTMSTVKLLSRIVAPTPERVDDDEMENKDLHDYTYGITSDPLTQFAVVFSALIHDVDHKGVPNFLLCKEDTTLAAVYNNQSVAEQNSIDVAWVLLMDPMFKDLRRAIYTTEDEMKRFRRLVVNSVMATDIFDKELSALRKNRWTKAFDGDASFSDTARCRKATVVIEHLIQASDVSHTMQHWHVYQKWNERLFREMYAAHVSGRWENDPTLNWYQGELNFFDSYIIPLAKKLKECGVFGVSSDEYLNYAERNRSEWERKGEEIVASIREKHCKVNTDMMELAKLDNALQNFSAEKKS